MACSVCQETGIVWKFQEQYGVGWYHEFCTCERGKQEEADLHAFHFCDVPVRDDKKKDEQ